MKAFRNIINHFFIRLKFTKSPLFYKEGATSTAPSSWSAQTLLPISGRDILSHYA